MYARIIDPATKRLERVLLAESLACSGCEFEDVFEDVFWATATCKATLGVSPDSAASVSSTAPSENSKVMEEPDFSAEATSQDVVIIKLVSEPVSVSVTKVVMGGAMLEAELSGASEAT